MLSHDLQVYYHQSWKRRVAGEGAYWVLAGSQDHASMSFWASQLKDSEWLEWHLENPRMMIHDDSWWSMTYDWSRTFHMNCHIHACKMCFGVSKRKSWTPGGKWCQLGSATRSWRQHLLEQPRAPDSILWVGPFWVWPRSWSCQQHWNRWLEGIVEKILETGFKQIENNKDFSTSKEIYGHPMDHGFSKRSFLDGLPSFANKLRLQQLHWPQLYAHGFPWCVLGWIHNRCLRSVPDLGVRGEWL